RRTHFSVNISDDPTITFPPWIQSQRQFVLAGACWIWRQVRNSHLDTVPAFFGMLGEIKFVGHVRAHSSEFNAIHKCPAVIRNPVEVQDDTPLGRQRRQEKLALQSVE